MLEYTSSLEASLNEAKEANAKLSPEKEMSMKLQENSISMQEKMMEQMVTMQKQQQEMNEKFIKHMTALAKSNKGNNTGGDRGNRPGKERRSTAPHTCPHCKKEKVTHLEEDCRMNPINKKQDEPRSLSSLIDINEWLEANRVTTHKHTTYEHLNYQIPLTSQVEALDQSTKSSANTRVRFILPKNHRQTNGWKWRHQEVTIIQNSRRRRLENSTQRKQRRAKSPLTEEQIKAGILDGTIALAISDTGTTLTAGKSDDPFEETD